MTPSPPIRRTLTRQLPTPPGAGAAPPQGRGELRDKPPPGRGRTRSPAERYAPNARATV